MDVKELFKHKQKFVVRKMDKEMIMVPLTNQVADMSCVFSMNETGCLIWEMIDGKNTEEDIITYLVNEFGIDEETAEKDLSEFLKKLNKIIIPD